MTAFPTERFVRLRHDGTQQHVHATATFLAADGEPPAAANHGLIAAIAAGDPERAERVQAGLRYLVAHDEAVMTWLEADPRNTALFTRDPRAALHQALPGLSPDFFDGWRAQGKPDES